MHTIPIAKKAITDYLNIKILLPLINNVLENHDTKPELLKLLNAWFHVCRGELMCRDCPFQYEECVWPEITKESIKIHGYLCPSPELALDYIMCPTYIGKFFFYIMKYKIKFEQELAYYENK